MRTSFELKYTSSDYEAAKEAAYTHIAKFLGLNVNDVPDRVDVELKVELEEGKYQVTAFGKMKNGVSVTSISPHGLAERASKLF